MTPIDVPSFVVTVATVVAVVANTVFVWPQAWKVLSGRTAGVSPATWLLSVGVGTVWMSWAHTSHNFWLLFVNVSSTVAALTILVAGTVRKTWPFWWSVGGVTVIGVGLSVGNVNPHTIIPFVLVSGFVFRLPQMVKVFRSTSVAGVSQTTWLLAGVNAGSWFIVSIAHGDWVTATSNIVAILSTIILIVLMGRKKKSSPPKVQQKHLLSVGVKPSPMILPESV